MMFREVLVRRGIRHRVSSGDPSEVFICCPFCVERGETPDQKFRLGVNVSLGVGHCFNCGWKSRKALFYLLKHWNILQHETILLEDASPQEEIPVRLPKDFQPLTYVCSDLDRTARRYVLSRGVTMGQIREKHIGVSFVGAYAYRIVFPVYRGQELCGVVARDFTGQQEPRYKNSLGGKSLYNLPTGNTSRRVVLSEGVFKALRIERLETGFSSSALLGSDITEEQIKQLHGVDCREVVLWPDPDKAGVLGAIKVADKLVQNKFLVGVVWPVFIPADEALLDTMKVDWAEHVEGYSWILRQRMLVGQRDLASTSRESGGY